MRRKIKEFISFKTISHLRYIPIILLNIKNWPFFILNYTGIQDQEGIYFFRNGIKIKTQAGIDSVTIMSVFFKKVYGDVNPNSVVIDIGANIGVYSIFAALKNAIVYAYEPEPTNFNFLLENIKLNNFEKNIFPFRKGVSGKEEKRDLYLEISPFHSLYLKNSSNKIKINKIQIDCIPLEKIFDENKIKFCDILKLDCEGAEFEILYNTPDECFKKIREIRMEYHHQTADKNYNITDLISFLGKRGFKVLKFKKESKNTGCVWLINYEYRN
jgi:FkbM family methyltransferase